MSASSPAASPATSDAARFVTGALCVVATVSIWAGWLVMVRFGVTATTLGVSDLAALRFAVAGPILLPVLIRRGLALDRLRWPGLIAVALGGGAPYALVVGAGLVFAPVADASVFTQGVLPLTIAVHLAARRLPRFDPAGLTLSYLS